MSSDMRYEHLLRAIGRFLDVERANGIRVTEDETYVSVARLDNSRRWETRVYRKGDETESLVAETRRDRTDFARPVNHWEEPLRTLGQELDQEGLELTRLEASDHVELTLRKGEQEINRTYSFDEIQYKSRMRSTYRGGSGPAKPRAHWWQRLFK